MDPNLKFPNSCGLIQDALGSIISIEQTAIILQEFLFARLLILKHAENGVELPPDEWPSACYRAALYTIASIEPSVADGLEYDVAKNAEKYSWEWHSSLHCRIEVESIDFMNIISEAGYIAGRISGIFDSSSPKPVSLFSTAPRQNTPLCTLEHAQARIGGFMLPLGATNEWQATPENRYTAVPTANLKQRLRPSYIPKARSALHYVEPDLLAPPLDALPSRLELGRAGNAYFA
ncbi:hypothetical protein B0H19DRAFT_1261703 [Mycena capillaripes]|nr:hypothetical protein B0H19DRAFT_1261703 [Mycena capillaripes]